MSKKGSSFGAPKPLAGQSGYKVSDSELLDKEARDMEIRLKNLQERMKMQQLEDESIDRPGGSRWGSARVDKGSLNSYAKDVKEKAVKKSMKSGKSINLLTGEVTKKKTNAGLTINNDPSKYADTTSSSSVVQVPMEQQLRSPPRVQQVVSSSDGEAPAFLSMVPSEWSVEDVSAWLATMNLAQYVGSFAKNEMNGVVLLDLSLEDLDYLGVTVLAHRKTIIKSVEDLRLNFGNPNMSPSEFIKTYSAIFKKFGVSIRSLQDLPKAPMSEEKPKLTTHWSQLEPLSANGVQNEPMPPNAADGDGGVAAYADEVLDEEAEKAAFQEAVMAWRNAGKTTTTASTVTKETNNAANNSSLAGPQSSPGGGGGEWVNPFAGPQSDDNHDHDYLFSNDPVKERKHVQIVKPGQQNAHRAEKSDSSTVTLGSTTVVASTAGGTQIVREPMSEEEERREREEFKKAVMEWRNAGKEEKPDLNRSDATGVGTSDAVKGSLLDQKNRNLALTEQLKRDMERQYEEGAQRLAEQKRLAQEQMEKASAELEAARKQLKESADAKESYTVSMSDDLEDNEEEAGWGGDDDDYEMVTSPTKASPTSRPEYSPQYGSKLSNEYKDSPVKASQPPSQPKIEMISSIALSDAKNVEDEPVQYYVEEASDDDDDE